MAITLNYYYLRKYYWLYLMGLLRNRACLFLASCCFMLLNIAASNWAMSAPRPGLGLQMEKYQSQVGLFPNGGKFNPGKGGQIPGKDQLIILSRLPHGYLFVEDFWSVALPRTLRRF